MLSHDQKYQSISHLQRQVRYKAALKHFRITGKWKNVPLILDYRIDRVFI